MTAAFGQEPSPLPRKISMSINEGHTSSDSSLSSLCARGSIFEMPIAVANNPLMVWSENTTMGPCVPFEGTSNLVLRSPKTLSPETRHS